MTISKLLFDLRIRFEIDYSIILLLYQIKIIFCFICYIISINVR